MSVNFLRVYDLRIGDADLGTGVRIFQTPEREGLRVQFEITKTLRSTLNTAVFKIFNLAPDNVGRIKGEFDEVRFACGYAGAQLDTFRGQIRWSTTYNDGTNDITEIHAADGERASKQKANFTLAANTTEQQLVDKLVSALGSTVVPGHIVITDSKRLRGRVVSGNALEMLARVAQQHGANVSIQDGRLDIVPAGTVLPDQAIVVRADTGLKEAPEVDDQGVKFSTQLDPRIRCNGRVHLDNHDLKLKVFKERERKPGAKPAVHPKKPAKSKHLARIDPQGIYKVYKVVHKGDTRSREWTSQVFSVGLDKKVPATQAVA
jgi:hypothetical protein